MGGIFSSEFSGSDTGTGVRPDPVFRPQVSIDTKLAGGRGLPGEEDPVPPPEDVAEEVFVFATVLRGSIGPITQPCQGLRANFLAMVGEVNGLYFLQQSALATGNQALADQMQKVIDSLDRALELNTWLRDEMGCL